MRNKVRKLVVPFLKERSSKLKNLIKLFMAQTYPSPNDKSLKKDRQKRLSKILISDQERFKLFLIRYQKFVLLTLRVDISRELSYLIRYYEELAISQGPVKTIKLFKQFYDLTLRVVTSNKFTPIEYLKSDRSGIPKSLAILKPLMEGSKEERRACLAALSVIKVIEVEDPIFTTKTICKESPIPQISFDESPKIGYYFKRYIESDLNNSLKIDLNLFRKCYIQELESSFPFESTRERFNKISRMSDIHLSGRNGPNGPALSTAVLDHGALVNLKGEETPVYQNIKAMMEMTNNKNLKTLIENFEEEPFIWSDSRGNRKVLHSRISLKREPWAKTRPFAICDYFSQSALKGFHLYLFKWLEEQPEDGTFRQDEASEIVRLWTESIPDDNTRVESADLSAATDSIPLECQAEMVSKIAGKRFAKIWMNLVSNREFQLPNGEKVRYKTGQPMGLLSSWAMLAVWHHIMVRSCLRYLNIERCQQVPMYQVIGDDVSMKGIKLFEVYQEVVSTVQGIGISKVKGFHKETQTMDNPIPFETDYGFMHTAELAKRVFCNGHEITIIPPDEVKTSLEDAVQFPEILSSLEKRRYPEIKITDLPALTALCHHRRLALLLSTSPVSKCPQLNEVTLDLIGLDPWCNIPWFKPGFDEELFKRQFTKVLREQIITTLLSVTANITEWVAYAFKGGEVKVKGWVYTCETQGLLLFLISEKCKNILEDLLDEKYLKEIFPRKRDVNIHLLRKHLSKMQILFDIDHLFKEMDINKEVSRKNFTNLIISKVLRKVASC